MGHSTIYYFHLSDFVLFDFLTLFILKNLGAMQNFYFTTLFYSKYIYFINKLNIFCLINFFIYGRKKEPYILDHLAHPQQSHINYVQLDIKFQDTF